MWAPKERDLGAETLKPVWEICALVRAVVSCWPVVSSTEHSAWHLEFCCPRGRRSTLWFMKGGCLEQGFEAQSQRN